MLLTPPIGGGFYSFFPLLPSDSEIIAGVWTRSCFTGGLGVGEGEGRGGEGGHHPPPPRQLPPACRLGFSRYDERHMSATSCEDSEMGTLDRGHCA